MSDLRIGFAKYIKAKNLEALMKIEELFSAMVGYVESYLVIDNNEDFPVFDNIGKFYKHVRTETPVYSAGLASRHATEAVLYLISYFCEYDTGLDFTLFVDKNDKSSTEFLVNATDSTESISHVAHFLKICIDNDWLLLDENKPYVVIEYAWFSDDPEDPAFSGGATLISKLGISNTPNSDNWAKAMYGIQRDMEAYKS